MGEQQEVIAELAAAGVLAGIRWAYESATRRSLETFSEADGHDSAWLGNTRFTLFRDRLDRVFACQRYAVIAAGGALDLDVLHAELSQLDLVTMPCVRPGLVCRADLRGSVGWAYRARRFLLASAEFGRLDTLPWLEKSPTKQLVAMQRDPDRRQPSLFEDLLPDEMPDGASAQELGAYVDPALLAPDRELRPATYVVAHTLDAPTGQVELIFGRPRLNLGGGDAWYWRQDLLTVELTGTRRQSGTTREAGGPSGVPDAPVRLRRIEGGRRDAAS